MDNQSIIYSQSDVGLGRFFAKIYGLVGLGIGLSALVSAIMLLVFPYQMLNILVNARWLYYLAVVVELALVFFATGAARKNSPAAPALFFLYSALNGFTLSFVLFMYAQTTVFQAFISSALVFFAMAAIGTTVKKDLSGMAKALMAALLGVIIATVVNWFIGSGAMSWLVSLVSVLIFSGLIAYDNQRIKQVYIETGGQVTLGWAVSMALSLYLDFINLFLNILRLFGSRD